MGTMLKSQKAETLWSEAHAWAPDIILSPEEFSPAIILQFSKSSNHIKRIPVKIKSPAEAFVFVDGQRIKSEDLSHPTRHSTALEPGQHQVSVLAPGANWTIKNFEIKEKQKFESLVVSPSPFVKGDCQRPEFVGGELPAKIKLLAEFDGCARVYSDHKWFTVEGGTPVTILSDDLKPGGNATLSSFTSPAKKDFFGSLIKSGWFWAGVGALVVGVVALSSSQTTTVPSHTTQ